MGARELMDSQGIEVVDLNLDEAEQMMRQFIQSNPELWEEDIGELSP